MVGIRNANSCWLTASLLGLSLVATCNKDGKATLKAQPCAHLPGFDPAALYSVGQPYVTSPEKRAEILNHYAELQLGMNESQVFSLLGRPAYVGDTVSAAVENVPPPCVETSWIYPLDTVGRASKTDAIVFVSFGKDGHVHWINPHNVPGLKEQGSPLD